MNTAYYINLKNQLYAIQNSLPDFLEPEERLAVTSKIQSLQNEISLLMEEMRTYDPRYQSM